MLQCKIKSFILAMLMIDKYFTSSTFKEISMFKKLMDYLFGYDKGPIKPEEPVAPYKIEPPAAEVKAEEPKPAKASKPKATRASKPKATVAPTAVAAKKPRKKKAAE
jgi:hypothetical protein